MGLRERKKEQTRRRIADVATRLFLARGYDAVTTAEVAQAAEVSPATLFNYFPAKEALVFDEDQALGDALVCAITARPAGTGVLDALRQAILAGPYLRFAHDPAYRPFFELIHSTPELASHARQMAARYEKAIAEAIFEARPVTDAQAQAVPHDIVAGIFTTQRNPTPRDAGLDLAPLTRAQSQAVAHYVVEALFSAQRSAQPIETFNTLIDLLKMGFAR